MNMSDDEDDGHLVYKDAIFLSPHKFIGGPGTPGILVAKKSLFQNRVPSTPGGGTVDYVSQTEHVFSSDVVEREEAGTPSIIGSVRAGMVMQLKEAVGVDYIQNKEHGLIRRAIERWSSHPNIRVLGDHDRWRLSIVSFMVRYDDNRYLHHHYVVALLNDLFGIQVRGGWQCAGPYGHRLLNIDLMRSAAYQREVLWCRGIKPGWARSTSITSFLLHSLLIKPYCLSLIRLKLMPDYAFEPDIDAGAIVNPTGRQSGPEDISYDTGRIAYRSRHATEPELRCILT